MRLWGCVSCITSMYYYLSLCGSAHSSHTFVAHTPAVACLLHTHRMASHCGMGFGSRSRRLQVCVHVCHVQGVGMCLLLAVAVCDVVAHRWMAKQASDV